jgi:hypothetical protein
MRGMIAEFPKKFKFEFIVSIAQKLSKLARCSVVEAALCAEFLLETSKSPHAELRAH